MFSNIKSHSSLTGSLHSNRAKKESDSPENTLKCLLTKETNQDGKNTDQQKKKTKNQSEEFHLTANHSDKNSNENIEKDEIPKKDFIKLLNVI